MRRIETAHRPNPLWITFIGLTALAAALGGCGSDSTGGGEKVDDWVYVPTDADEDGTMRSPPQAAPAPGVQGGGGNIGLSVGGAKGIENFRANIEEGYLPLATDITYEGMFYEYFFETGQSQPCHQLFCPSYTQMLSTAPLSSTPEQFISVGLNSGISAASFTRKKLNLVVVLDISGSMGSPFDAYYYDRSQPSQSTKKKMTVANESLVAMLDHLKPDDRFGMVLFESRFHLAKPLSDVGQTDMEAIKGHILEVTERGGTNMETGYEKGTELFNSVANADPAVYENRIIFLTDAMPNQGQTGECALLDLVEKNADAKIYTTFIGIGVDFNTKLIEAITKVRGANYYSVHSEEKFKKRMDEEFEFMVTPLVFDLQLEFTSTAFAIDAVYGSPEADQSTGVLMRVNTLFPSKVENGETKGGIVILKLEQTGAGGEIELAASYEDRQGTPYNNTAPFTFNAQLNVAPNTGIRKAILLSRYVRMMKEWIEDERAKLGPTQDPDLGPQERQSVPLAVGPTHKAAMQTFLGHLQIEAAALADKDLDREIDLLKKLIAWPAP